MINKKINNLKDICNDNSFKIALFGKEDNFYKQLLCACNLMDEDYSYYLIDEKFINDLKNYSNLFNLVIINENLNLNSSKLIRKYCNDCNISIVYSIFSSLDLNEYLLNNSNLIIVASNDLRDSLIKFNSNILLVPYNFKDKYDFIKYSGLFDSEYYLNNYIFDNSEFDPITHYLTLGVFENCNPSNSFNSSDYLNSYKYVKKYNLNPLIHFIISNNFNNFNLNLVNIEVFSENKELNKKICEDSGEFDETFYLNNNGDVKRSNYSAIDHWVKFGYKENKRNPNPIFSNEFYRYQYLNNNDKWNSLTHYILVGKRNGFKRNIFDVPNFNYSNSQADSIVSAMDNKVRIIVFFSNFSEIIKDSLMALFKNTFINFELLFIIDENSKSYLKIFLDDENIFREYDIITFTGFDDFIDLINENSSNFEGDVVLLNGFTRVTHNWLNNLILKAYSKNNIGFVTPLFNIVPELSPEFTKNSKFSLTIDGINTLISKSASYLDLNLSSFNGFCMFIKNIALKDFKLDNTLINFNSAFNTFSFELNTKWAHILDDSVFVYHNNEFFNTDIFNNLKVNEVYNNLILNLNEFSKLKNNFEFALKKMDNKLFSNRVLFVIKEEYLRITKDFYINNNFNVFDCYFLTYNSNELKLWKDNYVLLRWDIGESVDNSLKNIYLNILISLRPNIIQFNDFNEIFGDLVKLCKYFNVSTILNNAFSYNNSYKINYEFDKIISNNLMDTFDKSADIFDETINIDKLITISTNGLDKTIKILIPGDIQNFNDKICRYLKDIYDKSDIIEFHFLGKIPSLLEGLGMNHGNFNTDNLIKLINEIHPNYIGIFDAYFDIFDIVKVASQEKIPILVNNNDLLAGFVKENNGICFIDFDDNLLNSICNNYNFDNYYKLLKDYYLNDSDIFRCINNSNQYFIKTYLELGENSQKRINHKTVSKINKEIKFKDFDDFLANSYTNPKFVAPFLEEEKRCFAVMDNITKYLVNKTKSSDYKPLVSIIMPVYNRLDLIPIAMDSVLNQTYDNFELIIVDDGSTDGTVEYLKTIHNKKVKIFIQNENRGSSHARNIGLDNANGEYIAYLDSDNIWDSKYLEAMVGGFLELSDADALYCGQILFENFDSSPLAIRFGSFNKSLLCNRNYIDMNCFMHKKEIYDQIGGFDESLERLVDWDLILKISNNFKIYSIPVLLSFYYSSNANDRITDSSSLINEKTLIYNDYANTIQEKYKFKQSICSTENLKNLNHKVNIIIPNFESLYDLQICIDRILSFNLDNLKIIVVDNNSNESVKYYLKYLESKGLISLILNDVNYGFTYAVNQGIEISDPDADILLLNNDSMLTEGSIQVMQDSAYSLPDCGIIVPQQVLPGGTKSLTAHVPYAYSWADCDVNPSAIHKNIINIPVFHDGEVLELSFAPFFCVYIKRDVLNKSLGLDAELGRHYRSDRIFSYYLRYILGLKIYHVSNAVVYHKLQKATDNLRQNKDDFNIMFVKNRWEDDLAKKLGFNQAIWDFD